MGVSILQISAACILFSVLLMSCCLLVWYMTYKKKLSWRRRLDDLKPPEKGWKLASQPIFYRKHRLKILNSVINKERERARRVSVQTPKGRFEFLSKAANEEIKRREAMPTIHVTVKRTVVEESWLEVRAWEEIDSSLRRECGTLVRTLTREPLDDGDLTKEQKDGGYSASIVLNQRWEELDDLDALEQGKLLHADLAGRDTYNYENGDTYCGEWGGRKQGYGHREGRGIQFYANGKSYRGQWDRSLPNGRGTMVYADGGSFDGYFKDDLRHGKGKLIHPYGGYTEGEWQNDVSCKNTVVTVKTEDGGHIYIADHRETRKEGEEDEEQQPLTAGWVTDEEDEFEDKEVPAVSTCGCTSKVKTRMKSLIEQSSNNTKPATVAMTKPLQKPRTNPLAKIDLFNR